MPNKERQNTFEINAQSTGKRFSIKKDALRELGIIDGKTDKPKVSIIHLEVVDAETGDPIFNDLASLKSGNEVYGSPFEAIRPNQRIRVTVDLNPPPPKTIFVSYSRTDWDEYVEPLVKRLRSEKFNVWIDQYIIEGGKDWLDEINKALKDCSRMILCVSPEALKSKYVKMEYRYFFDQEKRLIPLICRQTELPAELRSLQFESYSNLQKLINLLKK